MQALIIQYRIADFDIRELSIDPNMLRANPKLLEEAISDYYAAEFKRYGGEAEISISNGTITIRWTPDLGIEGLIERGVELLSKGDYAFGVPLLEAALKRAPNDPTILLNLGMALSDLGRLKDSMSLLSHLVTLEPSHTRAWIALGVAQSRMGDDNAAEHSFKRSLELDPNDGYAHRNLGAIQGKKSLPESLIHLKRATELLPNDQAALYGYGRALLRNGSMQEAYPVLRRAIEIAPLTDLAERARMDLSKLAHKNLREAGGGAPRLDAVMYCLSALKLFTGNPQLCSSATIEIAMLGRNGLDINSPSTKYSLKSLPGEFTGLQLVSYMYVGMKQLSPDADAGIDLSREYEQALQLFSEG